MPPRDPYADSRIVDLDARRADAAPPTDNEAEIAAECRARVEEALLADRKFRQQRRADRAFMESQYAHEDLISRQGQRKPALELHPIRHHEQEILDDYRTAGAGFRIGSATSETGGDAAAAFNGLARRDQQDSNSESEVEKIILEAIRFGEGWGQWRIVDAEGDDAHDARPRLFTDGEWSEQIGSGAFDKRLAVRACDNELVFPDPRDDTPDRRNMDWFVEVFPLTVEKRDARYPRAARLPDSVFDSSSLAEGLRWWFPTPAGVPGRGEGPLRDREVMIAHYYRRRWLRQEYVWAPGFEAGPVRADRLSAEQQAAVAEHSGRGGVMRQVKQAPVVDLFVTDGLYLLEDRYRLPWGRIPYFRARGEEMRLNDGATIRRGLVFYMKDTSKALSISVSEAIWKQAIAPQDTLIAPVGSTTGQKKDWADLTVAKPGPRFYNAYARTPGPGGQREQLPAPQFITNQPAIESLIATAAALRDMIAMTAGGADPQQRDTAGQYRSAAALDRMDRLASVNRSAFIWNAEHITARSMGDIWLSMARWVYDRPGRLVMISGEAATDADEGWLIGVPFIRDPRTGAPIPMHDVPDGVMEVPIAEGATAKVYRFNPPRDAVKVTTYAANLATAKKDAVAEWLMNIMTARPELVPALATPMLKAAADTMPVEDAMKSVQAFFPPPVAADDTDFTTLLPRFQQAMQKIQQLEQNVQVLQQAADQVAAAKVLADEKNRTDLEKTRMQTEQRADAAVLAAASKTDDLQDTLRAHAALDGLKLGAEAVKTAAKKQDGGSTNG